MEVFSQRKAECHDNQNSMALEKFVHPHIVLCISP